MNETKSRFLDPVIVRVATDNDGRANFIVERAFFYWSARLGREIEIPMGTLTDGPSIPSILSPLVGGYPGFRAAIVHDYLVRNPSIMQRSEADEIFLEAMIEACGVDPVTAQNMYLAVRAYTSQIENEARGWSNSGEMNA
jgi:hypothetical protein